MEQATLGIGGANGEEVKKRKGYKPLHAPDTMTHEELQRIVKAPDRRTSIGKRDYAILCLFSTTPMRRQELCNLKRNSCVNEGERKYIVYHVLKKRKKNGDKPRFKKIQIAEYVYEAVESYVSLEPSRLQEDFLFRTSDERGAYEAGPISPYAIHKLVKKYAKLANINKRISPHSFRHTFFTLRKDKYDPFILTELGDWESIDQALTYARNGHAECMAAALDFPVGG